MVPNYLSTELDRQTTVAGVVAARAIANSPSMRGYVKREHKPGVSTSSYDELLEYCRNNGQTIFHPSGTAKMGNDAMSVVDERLRVHGVQGLRVVDCSIMPTLVSGNTNAPAFMIAEKAVDMIRQDHYFVDGMRVKNFAATKAGAVEESRRVEEAIALSGGGQTHR